MAEELEKLEYEDIPRGETDWDVPVNERFSWIKEEWNKLVEKIGAAAYEDTGTGPDEVPTNSDLDERIDPVDRETGDRIRVLFVDGYMATEEA